jgi:hypothetical protein
LVVAVVGVDLVCLVVALVLLEVLLLGIPAAAVEMLAVAEHLAQAVAVVELL